MTGAVTVATTAERIGFVGIGTMGTPMARCVAAKGATLVLYDADTARAAQVAGELGASTADSPALLGRGCDVVVTMLPTGQIVRDVVLGPEGVASTLAPGSTIIDMSSSDPTGTVELGRALAPGGIALIDAPVSGGPSGAAAGTLSIMIGGDDEAAIERCRPILEAMGQRLTRTGKLGSGHATKALNNFLAATSITAMSEALVIGRRFGLDPATLLEVVNASTGASLSSQTLFPSQVLTRKFALGFSLALMAKDVGLAAGLAETLGVEAPLCRDVAAAWAAARDALGGGADFTEMARHVEVVNGLEAPAS